MNEPAKQKKKNINIDTFRGTDAMLDLIQKFREWNLQWSEFDKRVLQIKPLSIDQFVNKLETEFVVGYKFK